MSNENEQQDASPNEESDRDDQPLRIAVLGAGPIGLEVVLYGRYLGYQVSLFDQADVCEALVGISQTMSAFRDNCTPLALAAIEAQNGRFTFPAAEDRLSIEQWRINYCVPLAKTDLVRRALRMRTSVNSITFDAENETYELVAETQDDASMETETYDYVIDTRQINTHAGSQSSHFSAADTEDFFVLTGNDGGFDFSSAKESIVRIFALIGERDGLNVYESLHQYAI